MERTVDKFEESGFSANDRTMDSFELSESLGTQMSGLNIQDSPSKYNNPYYAEERKLTGTGQYDMTLCRNEFDIEEDFDEVVEAKENKAELNQVVDNYKRILEGDIKEVEDISPKKSDERLLVSQGDKFGNQRLQIKNALGDELYMMAYEFIKYHRRKGTDEAVMHAELKKMVGGDKRLMNFCFNLDGIVFLEL
jgi:hypothetical protein